MSTQLVHSQKVTGTAFTPAKKKVLFIRRTTSYKRLNHHKTVVPSEVGSIALKGEHTVGRTFRWQDDHYEMTGSHFVKNTHAPVITLHKNEMNFQNVVFLGKFFNKILENANLKD